MLKQISKLVQNFCMIEDLDFKISLASDNPKELLKHITANSKQGIYFLDVNLEDDVFDGFKLGKKIREIDPRGFLIYISTHEELLPETFTYHLEAMDYILKDNPEQMIQRVHSSLLTINTLLTHNQSENPDFFTVKSSSRTIHVPLSSIDYFETTHKKHIIGLVTSEEYIEFYGNLTTIEHKLSTSFIRTHQSYLVSIDSIKYIDKKNKLVILNNKSTCLLARSKIKEINSILFDKTNQIG